MTTSHIWWTLFNFNHLHLNSSVFICVRTRGKKQYIMWKLENKVYVGNACKRFGYTKCYRVFCSSYSVKWIGDGCVQIQHCCSAKYMTDPSANCFCYRYTVRFTILKIATGNLFENGNIISLCSWSWLENVNHCKVI